MFGKKARASYAINTNDGCASRTINSGTPITGSKASRPLRSQIVSEVFARSHTSYIDRRLLEYWEMETGLENNDDHVSMWMQQGSEFSHRNTRRRQRSAQTLEAHRDSEAKGSEEETESYLTTAVVPGSG